MVCDEGSVGAKTLICALIARSQPERGPHVELNVFWTTLARRWYFLIIALACTIGATLLVVDRVGPTYQAQGSVLIFPPVATAQRETKLEVQGNPYLVLSGVSQARDIVIRELTSKSTREELAEQHPGSSFEATPDYMNSAPIILLTVKADSATIATNALEAVMDRVPETLAGLQSGLNLPANAVITSRPLISDTQPDVVRKGQIRAGIVTSFVTMVLSLLVIGLIDRLLAARRATAQPTQYLSPTDEQYWSIDLPRPMRDRPATGLDRQGRS
jgi:capsular polysaccharide biosynthesis protein